MQTADCSMLTEQWCVHSATVIHNENLQIKIVKRIDGAQDYESVCEPKNWVQFF